MISTVNLVRELFLLDCYCQKQFDIFTFLESGLEKEHLKASSADGVILLCAYSLSQLGSRADGLTDYVVDISSVSESGCFRIIYLGIIYSWKEGTLFKMAG